MLLECPSLGPQGCMMLREVWTWKGEYEILSKLNDPNASFKSFKFNDYISHNSFFRQNPFRGNSAHVKELD